MENECIALEIYLDAKERVIISFYIWLRLFYNLYYYILLFYHPLLYPFINEFLVCFLKFLDPDSLKDKNDDIHKSKQTSKQVYDE